MDKAILDKYQITKNTMMESALHYAEAGLAVFPLKAQGKEPITKNGLKDATTDHDTIIAMWTKYPYANIGMACGQQSGGIIVIDVDTDEEAGKDGFRSLQRWEKQHGAIPDTANTITGRGGNHFLFRTSGDTRSRVACEEDVDIRADGGYIVLPPSVHPNGKQYQWEYELDEYGIAEANQSVIDLMNNGVEEGKTFTMPEVIPNGQRNGTLYKLACSMQARGNGDDAIRAAVSAENKSRCNPPLDQEELDKLVNSALTKQKGTAVYKDTKKKDEKTETKPLQPKTLTEIEEMDLQPPEFLIEDMLPKGVCILGAPPKLGKSWMALDMALQIANGGFFLNRRCKKAGVLYLALEDSWYRLIDRAKVLLDGEPLPTENLLLDIYADKIVPEDTESGLYKQLEEQFDLHPNIELVIIDTLQLVRPSKQKGDDEYASVYRLLNSIRPFWQDRQIGFLLIHHTRKRSINDYDPFETFLGSQGLTGATDGMFLIQSVKGEDYCMFYGRGRDFEDVMEYIVRDEDTCRWKTLGSKSEVEAFEERRRYETNPIVVMLRKLTEQCNGLPQDIQLKELRERIQDELGETVGSSEKSFSNELKELKRRLLERDGIKVEPLGNTTRNGKRGTYFRVSKNKD